MSSFMHNLLWQSLKNTIKLSLYPWCNNKLTTNLTALFKILKGEEFIKHLIIPY